MRGKVMTAKLDTVSVQVPKETAAAIHRVAKIAGVKVSAYGKTHDCGRYGQLRISEIVAISGVNQANIRRRIQRGWKGSDLCLRARVRPVIRSEQPRYSTMLVALKLAREFDDFESVPTTSEIRRCHAMSTRTAMRWRQTFHRAIREDRS